MIPMTLNLFILVTLIGVHIIFMSGYIFGKLVDGNIVSNDEGQGSLNSHPDILIERLSGRVRRSLIKMKMHTMTFYILIILTVWFLEIQIFWWETFLEYGQKLVTDSLHTLGTNIKKRLHGQLMETDLEDPDVFTFHDNSKQPFKTYINDDIVRVSFIASPSLPILFRNNNQNYRRVIL